MAITSLFVLAFVLLGSLQRSATNQSRQSRCQASQAIASKTHPSGPFITAPTPGVLGRSPGKVYIPSAFRCPIARMLVALV